MTNSTTLRSAVCIAALLAGSTAQANVTAAEVWEDWKSQILLYGEDNVSIGAEETAGGTLTIRDLSVNFVDEDVQVISRIGDIVFDEQSDGSVRVSLADSFPVAMIVDDGTIITMLVSQTNLEMIASGEPDMLNYELSADEYRLTIEDVLSSDGESLNGEAFATIKNIKATYRTTVGEMREISYNATADMIDAFANLEGQVVMAAKYSGLSTQGEVSMPLDADLSGLDGSIPDGVSVAGGYIIDNTSFAIDANMMGGISASVETGQTVLTGNFSDVAIDYESLISDVIIAVNLPTLPAPVNLTILEYGIGANIPTAETETAVPLALHMDILELSINDELWDVYDPAGLLPRDPMNFQLDLSGSAIALADITQMEDPADLGAGLPLILEGIDLNTLSFDGFGATVKGQGAFTFDNDDTQTFAPLPRPMGDANIAFSGINALLNNLTATGLVPMEYVMGPRMMLGMLARNTGEDQMEIDVEINKAGEVMVNGNRVR